MDLRSRGSVVEEAPGDTWLNRRVQALTLRGSDRGESAKGQTTDTTTATSASAQPPAFCTNRNVSNPLAIPLYVFKVKKLYAVAVHF